MKKWLKENWFEVVVIILLLMCYGRLGEISDGVFYVADTTDSTGRDIRSTIEDSASDTQDSINNLEGYLDEINNNTRY